MRHYTSIRGRTRWRCCKSFNKCRAIAITHGNQIVKLTDLHNHIPDVKNLERPPQMHPHSIHLSPLQRTVEVVNVPFHCSAQIHDETETKDDKETDVSNETNEAPGSSLNPNETGDDPGSSSDCDEIPMVPCDVTLITD